MDGFLRRELQAGERLDPQPQPLGAAFERSPAAPKGDAAIRSTGSLEFCVLGRRHGTNAVAAKRRTDRLARGDITQPRDTVGLRG